MDNNKKYFLSFGNERFIKSRESIINESKNINIFDYYILETESICKEKLFQDVISKIPTNRGPGRGYYYYMWKPYIIYKNLKKMNDGDILFYCDSGMKIINNDNNIKKFKFLFDSVSNSSTCESGILTFITTGPREKRLEYMFNLSQLFKHFNIESNKDITDTQQVQAGISIFYKCKNSMKIVEEWFNTSQNYPEYFCGDPRVFPILKLIKQRSGYIDHRHDQSIWSILCKIRNVNILTHDKNPIHQTHFRE